MTIDKLNDYALKICLDKKDLKKYEADFSDIDSAFIKMLITMLADEISDILNIDITNEKLYVEVFAKKIGCVIFISCSAENIKAGPDGKILICQSENFESIAELCIQLKNFHMKKIKFCSLYGNNYHIRLILGIKSDYYSISGIASRYCKIIPGNEINMSATEEYFQCVEPSDAIEKILLQTGK